jgi:hypothetical protein
MALLYSLSVLKSMLYLALNHYYFNSANKPSLDDLSKLANLVDSVQHGEGQDNIRFYA